MRVAVVGATGNVGTAVLDCLREVPNITSVLGIARRMPDTTAAPYSSCDWASIDVAAASSHDSAVERLTQAFDGVDAVIHLAWLIQPNSQRDLLRRVNVEGTARVAEAVANAGVPHLVVASSVGAYSPDKSVERRDETWLTNGISTSHYSVDKAAQEEVLDRFEVSHPEVIVTRLRPALIFGAAAASEIQRYFLGAWMPLEILRKGRLPFLPIPQGFRGVQAVHSEDVAQAYTAAVLHRPRGAFNICADDVLGSQELADIVDHGRFVEMPARLMRTALGIGHSSRLVAADEGWLDMGLAVPIMDSTRARNELDWRPRHSATDSLRHLLKGMAHGQGSGSVPLSPRNLEDSDHVVHRSSSASENPEDGHAPGIDMDLLGLYLSDHLAGATAGSARIARMAAAFVDTPVYAVLSEIAEEISRERAFLPRVIEELGLKRAPVKEAITWTGEHIGRLKTNGAVVNRSPLTMVLETELMRSAIVGKLGMWQTLEDNAAALGLQTFQFAELVRDARQQLSVLDTVHEYARRRAFCKDRATFDHNANLSPVRPPAAS